MHKIERCPKDPNGVHSYSDHTYWGCNHPKCDLCGYEDVTRVFKEGKPVPANVDITDC